MKIRYILWMKWCQSFIITNISCGKQYITLVVVGYGHSWHRINRINWINHICAHAHASWSMGFSFICDMSLILTTATTKMYNAFFFFFRGKCHLTGFHKSTSSTHNSKKEKNEIKKKSITLNFVRCHFMYQRNKKEPSIIVLVLIISIMYNVYIIYMYVNTYTKMTSRFYPKLMVDDVGASDILQTPNWYQKRAYTLLDAMVLITLYAGWRG